LYLHYLTRSDMRRLTALALTVSLLSCSDTEERRPVADHAPLRVCVGQADPPRAVRPGEGFDVDFAKLLANALERPLELVWLPRPKLRDIEETDLNFGPLIEGSCDLQLSIPGKSTLGTADGRIALSRPYYGTSFELLPADGDLGLAKRVAVRANSVAHILVDRRGIPWTMQPDAESTITALNSGRADAALVWGPNLAGTKATRNENFDVPRVLRWNQHAAVHRQNIELLNQIDAIIGKSTAQVQSLLASHGIPQRQPFKEVHQSEDLSQP